MNSGRAGAPGSSLLTRAPRNLPGGGASWPLACLPLVPPSPGVAGSPHSGQPGPQLPERPAEQAHAPARSRPEGLRGDLPRAATGQHGRPSASVARPLDAPAWPLLGSSPHAPSSQAGANINAVDKQQRTPLMEAVVNNHLEAARYMVQRGGCVYSKVCRAGRGAQGPGWLRRASWRTHLPLCPSGGGWLHLPPPRSQNWELGDGQPAAQHRTGGRERPG